MLKNIGLRWYHYGFAVAYGLGSGIVGSTGGKSAGSAGYAVGSVVGALPVTIIVTAIIRRVSNWRPEHVEDVDVPDSRLKYAIFALLAIEMFVFGVFQSTGPGSELIGVFLLPFNLLLAAAIAADIWQLRKQGVEWGRSGYIYAVASVFLFYLAGLAYWWQRGRRRAPAEESAIDSEPPSPNDQVAPTEYKA